MWRDLAGRACPDVELFAPAGAPAIERAETSSGQPVPPDLRSLLLETDGLCDAYGTSWVWGTARLVAENLAMRSSPGLKDLCMPFDDVMFFGEAGNGDLFFFPRRPPKDEVFVWDHENDSRTWLSGSLEDFVTRALRSDGEDWYR